MTTGLYKKVGMLLCLFVVDIFTVVAIHYGYNFSLTMPVFFYLIATEGLSIYENSEDTNLIQIMKKILEEVKKK